MKEKRWLGVGREMESFHLQYYLKTSVKIVEIFQINLNGTFSIHRK